MTTTPATTDSPSDVHAQRDRNYAFMMGLLAGGLAGVGLGMLFAPRAVLELKKRAADSARALGDVAADQCRQASTRLGVAVDEIARKGQGLRDDLSDAVVRGAQKVERIATAAKSGH